MVVAWKRGTKTNQIFSEENVECYHDVWVLARCYAFAKVF